MLLILAPAGAAKDRKPRSVFDSPRLWSTINFCDSRQHPDTLGVRASMPGSGRKGETMWMRFQAQYRSRRDGLWHNFLGEGVDSGPVKVGSARFKARQSGWAFPFEPKPGERYRLRGVVTFEWRKGGKVVRRAKKRTTSGHKPAVADPKGYSAASCWIAG